MNDTESECPESGRLARPITAHSRADAWREDPRRKYSHYPSKSLEEKPYQGLDARPQKFKVLESHLSLCLLRVTQKTEYNRTFRKPARTASPVSDTKTE